MQATFTEREIMQIRTQLVRRCFTMAGMVLAIGIVACSDRGLSTEAPDGVVSSPTMMTSAVFMANGDSLVLVSGDRYSMANSPRAPEFSTSEHIENAFALERLRDRVLARSVLPGPNVLADASVNSSVRKPLHLRKLASSTVNGHSVQVALLPSKNPNSPPAGSVVMINGHVSFVSEMAYERVGRRVRVTHMRTTFFGTDGKRTMMRDDDYGSSDVAMADRRANSYGASGVRAIFAGLGRLAAPDVLYAATVDEPDLDAACQSFKTSMEQAADAESSAAIALVGARTAVAIENTGLATLRALALEAGTTSYAMGVAIANAVEAVAKYEGLAALALTYAALKTAQLGYATAAWQACRYPLPWQSPAVSGNTGSADDSAGGSSSSTGDECDVYIDVDSEGDVSISDPNGCLVNAE